MSRFAGGETPERTRIYDIRDGRVLLGERGAIPYRPMIGTIGTAPEEEAVSSYLPGPHGGNMDIADLSPGCRVHLPVFVDGALLHIGDAHAAQGDGEISGTAVEMPSVVTLKVDLIRGRAIRWPRIDTAEEIGVIACSGTGRTLEDAIRLAYVELIGWLVEEYGFDRAEALQLCSFLGRVRLGNIWSAAAKFPKQHLR
jgi:acetamidase/formamidase